MSRVFVDTFYYVALLSARDAWHSKVVAYHQTLAAQLISTEAILLELANALAAGPLRLKAAELVHSERASPDTVVLPINSALLDDGLRLYEARGDKTRSLTDCISFVVMNDQKIEEALTADHHFVQAGFRAIFGERSPE